MTPRQLATGIIRVYRLFISPFMAPHCRFHPSCSAYAEQAIAQHGVGRGIVLALKRLGRCHPLHPGGHDPVPDSPENQTQQPTAQLR